MGGGRGARRRGRGGGKRSGGWGWVEGGGEGWERVERRVVGLMREDPEALRKALDHLSGCGAHFFTGPDSGTLLHKTVSATLVVSPVLLVPLPREEGKT